MSLRTRLFVAATVTAFAAPSVSFAQSCVAADEAARRCLIDPTVTSTTVIPAVAGYVSAPVVAAARYLGGIAYFQSEFYFFQGFGGPGFNVLNPLANPANYTYLGGKPENSSIIDPPGPWIALPGVYSPTQEMVFGIRVRTSDYAPIPTYTTDWYFTGFGPSRNFPGRFSQNGDFDYGFSNVFLGGTAPVSDQQLVSGLRAPSPAGWTNPWQLGNGYFNFGSAKAILGFEDNRGFSDGDFNDAVIALDFSTVPEPSSMALMALGLGAIATLARRRRKE